jgi:hypothetical protein
VRQLAEAVIVVWVVPSEQGSSSISRREPQGGFGTARITAQDGVQQYLHFELTSRWSLLLVTSNLVTSRLVLPAFEHPVRVVEPNEVAVG